MIEQQSGDVCYLQFNHLRQFSTLHHGAFTRAGGYSEAPYHGLNTSTPPRGKNGDSIENVVRNRQQALQALGLEQTPTITLWQVHGADVVPFRSGEAWRSDWGQFSYYEQAWTPETIRKGDASISNESGIALALSFADCVPIVFYDPVQRVIGIAHGGWRGTARGIVVATVEAMYERYGSRPDDIYAGIGPAIGACCYEVSHDVQQLFMGERVFEEMPTRDRYREIVRAAAVFSAPSTDGHFQLDLQATNRNQLLLAGLAATHIEVMEICTACNTDRFFSHRKEQGQTGRFPVVIAQQPG
ncbi:MAG TPA: peptidoglycan editing factor PgeF [Ktedonobacteraceae bacterium]|nr:peptidoglycan editing factor PgeF [Ktedonobacteraceae bacterium]